MSINPEVPVFELSPSNPRWDTEAACLGEDSNQFYVKSTVSPDSKDITSRLCRNCPVAEDCLIEAITIADMSVEIVAGMTRDERRPLIQQYQRVQRQQAKEKRDPTVNLNGILDAIAEHIQKLRAGEKVHLNYGNTVHDPRWQGKYSKRSAVDQNRVSQFLVRFAATQ